MKNLQKSSLFVQKDKMSDLISDHYEMLNVLSRFGIALGFGEKSIKDVCVINDVDCDTFLAVVNLILSGSNYVYSFKESSVESKIAFASSLAGYLKMSHNYFLDFKFPIIRDSLQSALSGGGKDLQRIIMKYYDDYASEVRKHMEYENDIIFPYTDKLITSKRTETKYSIHIFSEQHDDIQTKLSELKDIIIKYYPAHSSNELNSVLYDIFVCAKDLEYHNRVEDKLLVPIIESLESDFNKSNIVTEASSNGDSLSEREKEVLIAIVHGLTNKEIAAKLFLSTHTVNTHRRNIINKLQIHSPAGLTIYALVNNIVDINDIKGLI